MAGKQAENTLHENAIGWGILLGVFAVILYVLWYYYDVEVREIVRWIRYSEMWLVSWFVGDDYTVLFKNQPVNWQQGFEDTPKWHKEELTFDHLSYFAALAMQPLKNVFIGIFVAGALWCMFYGPGKQYRSTLGLEGLIKRQAKNFKVIAPFVKFNPSKQPPRPPGAPVPAELPAFAEALGPEEWLAYNVIPVPDGQIDVTAATEAFRKQLGERWKGPKALAPYKQILLAAFCLKAARKRNEADDMLGRIASCWSFEGGLKLSRDPNLLREARAILNNSDLSGKLLAKINRHAFETTAMLRALQTAREEGGVLAPAQFVWLRAHDRALWYPLNNLGRHSYHMEALGAMSHFRIEKMTQRPVPVPKLEDAVQTITEYMKSIRARPIPQLDYSGSKKRGIKKAR
jgi:intracellular multiplication protein IcmP